MITTESIYKTKRICSLMITHVCNLNCVYCFEKYKNKGEKFMSFETAKMIILKEIDIFSRKHKDPMDRFAIEFFGGEPLLNFPLIKEIFEWVCTLDIDFPLMFQTTTNGTLFNKANLEWFTLHKNSFRVVVSIDGDQIMHQTNRGCDNKKMPLDYIVNNWPNSYFKMTVSRETLHSYAKGIIELTTKGYKVPSSLAEGVNWTWDDCYAYKEELLKIASFYLSHPECKPDQPFDYSFTKLLYDWKVPPRNCGVGVNVSIYDTDGKVYPCHLFLPIVTGEENIENVIKSIDFENDSTLIDEHCLKCPIRNICRTCYGYNQLERGGVMNRNMTKCKMQLVEAEVISSFQIQYFLNKKSHLTKEDKLNLKAALTCYKLVHNNKFGFNKSDKVANMFNL